MKNLLATVMILFFLAGTITLVASCNSSSKKSAQNAADSLASAAKNTVQSFSSQVSNFDSTWNGTLTILDTRIHQWDSTSQTYKGSLKAKMEKQVAALKVQRDSLKAMIGQASSQSQTNWVSFSQSVSSKYDSILAKMQNLAGANQ
ncbi:MAG: hypothetical protein EPN39_12365 [Chitinophagaceae bacterium]|jgi:hypothetical protein|nr:MAG: hypothetical protein EPN39_12365 [Chitinophagaceae bacterium]